jgi:putative drug exporter of the RND superfamily
MAKTLHRLGTFSVKRNRVVLIGWLVFLVLLGGIAFAVKGEFSSQFRIPGTESDHANKLIGERIPGVNGDAATGKVVFAAPTGAKLSSPRAAAAIAATVKGLEKVAGVESAGEPVADKAISPDGRIGFSAISFAGTKDEVGESQREAIAAATRPATEAGLQVRFAGAAAPEETAQSVGEALGVIVALLVLTITFGSLLTAGLPLLTGVFGVGLSALMVVFVTAIGTLSENATTLAIMLGLAVGIDYTLFIVSRHRTQVHDGMTIEESIPKAVATAGSAVVFAGSTVIIALCALWATGVPFLGQIGLGAAFAVAFAVALSLSFVPALLAFGGRRFVKGKTFSAELPSPGGDAKAPLGARWVALVVRFRYAAIVIPVVGLLALASPALDMRLGLPNDGTANPDTTQRQAYDLLSEGFGPGFNGPLTVVADLEGTESPDAAAGQIAKRIEALPDVASVAAPSFDPKQDLAIIAATPSSGPSSTETEGLVEAIRGEAAALRASTGAEVLVTGETATNIDISSHMSDVLPLYLGIVVGLAALLLMIAFRSIPVPLSAIAGFMLTIVASFGVVTLVFQKGVLAGLFGVSQTGPLVSLLPILIIGVIFGLAMDYQVFLVSRMREEVTFGAAPVDAVRVGFRHSARIVTAAALIMIAVFAGFILPSDPIVKSIGLAFATGILIDAFVVRMTLIPALMAVLGARAWWLPRWLARVLPHVDIEGASIQDERPAPRPSGPVVLGPEPENG